MTINRNKWTFIWGGLVLFFYRAWWDLYQGFILIGNPPSLQSKRFVVFLAFQIIPLAFWAYILWVIRTGRYPKRFIDPILNSLERIPSIIKGLLVSVFLLVPPYLYMVSSFGDMQIGSWFRLETVIFFAFLATVVLFPKNLDTSWPLRFSGMIMLAAVIFITCDWLTEVSAFPFSMGWSEGNRMWDYSMLFGSNRYINLSGEPIFTFIEVGRQILFAIPFLFPNVDIFTFRLWSVLIWILPPLLLGATCVLGRPNSGIRWLGKVGFIIWTYLFLSQGPIYPPLLLSAALMVVGIRQRSWILGMAAIALASYYCEMSRWTWMYAPGIWAGMLTLMDADNPGFTYSGWKKLIKPVVFGLSGYFGGEFLPKIVDFFINGPQSVSEIVPIRIPGELVQPMLWDRLFPNPTYAPGILLGTLWVGLPIMLFIFWAWKTKIWKPNWLQASAVVVICTLFMILGVIVSVKIGGGSNLHNLDMLWVTFALVAGWIWKRWMDAGFNGMFENKRLLAALCLAVAIPFTTMVESGQPLRLPEQYLVNGSLETIRSQVAAAQKKGDVLFIDQRQLLTFGYVKDVPLIAEYEKKYLMNQALSANSEYFAKFHKALENKEYSLIISEPLRKTFTEESERNFSSENNAWVFWVSRPLLTYYKPLVTLDEVGVQLLIPRE
jgi:hypothetical protein